MSISEQTTFQICHEPVMFFARAAGATRIIQAHEE